MQLVRSFCFFIFEDENFEETYIRRMHTRGVLFHPFDPQMITFSHNEEDVKETLSIAEEVLHILKLEHPHHFSHPEGGTISKEAMRFRTAHELGGWIDYRRPVSELPKSWDQVDR